MKILFKLQIFFWVLLFLVIGLSINLIIDFETAVILRGLKKSLLFSFIGVSILRLISTKMRGVNFNLVLIFSLFPIYYFIISIFYKDSFNMSIVGMYILWWLYLSMIAPNLVYNFNEKKTFFKFIKLSVFVILLVGVFAFFNDFGYFQKERLSFGFENPNFFAQYLLVGLLCIFALKTKLNKVEFLYMIFLIILVLFSFSRNVIFFIISALIWFWMRKLNVNKFLKIFFSIFLLLLFVVGDYNYTKVNDLSHGRLLTWYYQLDQLSQQGETSYIFGSKRFINHHFSVESYSRFSENSPTPTKIRSDNVFLETFLESGIIGLMLFLIPFAFLWKQYSNMKKRDQILYESIMIGAFFQGLFITNFISFFAPISLFLPLIINKKKN